MNSKECIVKIEITWKDYKFQSKLTRYTAIPEGIESIVAVMKQNLPLLPTVVSRHLMKLSDEECSALYNSSSCVQIVSSRHIMIKANGKVYKIIYSHHESKALFLYYHKQKRHCPFINMYYSLFTLRST